jgi:hypothetical protein
VHTVARHIKEDRMTSKHLSGVLIIALSFVLRMPAEAQFCCTTTGSKPFVSGGTIVGVVVGAAAVVAVVAVVVIHYSKKRAITGCVISGESGMTLTDEKDKQIYMLSGNTTDIKPGDRMKLQGKRVKPKSADKTVVWEARQVSKNYGACSP